MKKTKLSEFDVQLGAFKAFCKSVGNSVETFAEFDGIVRKTINWKQIFHNKEDFTRMITMYSRHLEE